MALNARPSPPELLGKSSRKASALGLIVALVAVYALVRGLAHVAQWPWLYAVLALPGTAMHEAAHWGVAWLLNGHPQSLSLWPSRLPDGGYMLGSVQFVPTAWNVAAVSLAPLGLFGVAAVCVVQALRMPRWRGRLLWVYAAACAFSSCWPSGLDWHNALHAPLSWPVALGLGLIWYGGVGWWLRRAWVRALRASPAVRPRVDRL